MLVKAMPGYAMASASKQLQGAKWAWICMDKEGVNWEEAHLPDHSSFLSYLLEGKYKNNAERRKLNWTLSTRQFEFLVQQPCYYCNQPPSNALARRGELLHYTGIDRVDNTKGYTPENTVPCCKTCNYAKREMSQQEFLSWIERVYKHSVRKEGKE